MENGKIVVRKASGRDGDSFIALVRELADYEKLPPPGRREEARLRRDAFGGKPRFELLMAFRGGKAVGYAAFFMTYSTFLARPTLYLEDIYISQESRRSGVGSAIFAKLAATAARRGCGRMEWSVLRWNKPAIAFYRGLGAGELKEWTYYRLAGDAIREIAGRKGGRRGKGAEGEI